MADCRAAAAEARILPWRRARAGCLAGPPRLSVAWPLQLLASMGTRDPAHPPPPTEMAFMFHERHGGRSTIDYPLGGSRAIVDALVRGARWGPAAAPVGRMLEEEGSQRAAVDVELQLRASSLPSFCLAAPALARPCRAAGRRCLFVADPDHTPTHTRTAESLQASRSTAAACC